MTPDEKVHEIYDKVGDLLQGLSVLEATFVIGFLVADQVQTKEDASEVCKLIEEAAHYVLSGDALDAEPANEMPV